MKVLGIWMLSLIWRAVMYRVGVQWLSPANNERAHLATFRATFGFALLFTVIHWVCTLLAHLPGAGVLVWGAYACLWLYVFAGHFGLGFLRAVGLGVLMFIAMRFFHSLAMVVFY